MIAKNYMELPTEGLTRGCMLDEGNAVTVYLDVREEERPVGSGSSEGAEMAMENVKVGYAVRCLKPFSEDRLVDAAIQTAFGLRDVEVSRFNTDMAMKIAEGMPTGREIVREMHGDYAGIHRYIRSAERAFGGKQAILPIEDAEIINSCGYIFKGSTNMMEYIEDFHNQSTLQQSF